MLLLQYSTGLWVYKAACLSVSPTRSTHESYCNRDGPGTERNVFILDH
jgi:hypothetical protein